MLQNSESYSKKSLLLLISFICLSVMISCSGSSEGGDFTAIKGVDAGQFNQTLANQGKKIFSEKCASCHKYDVKLVGPPLGTVVKRRTVDYIFSQILHPEQMIAKNDTVKALLAKYMTSMPNQHLNMLDAKAVYNHLLDVSNGGGK